MWENKKGTKVKGKAFNLKIILTSVLALVAGVCFCLGTVKKPNSEKLVEAASTKVALGMTGAKEDYSALFDGDIIFSAEKVRVSSTEVENFPVNLESADKTFYTTYSTYTSSKTETGNGTLTLKNLPKTSNENKTVIDNGEFVKFDNLQSGDDFYIDGEEGSQEALLISFGSYIYNGEDSSVEIAYDNTKYAGITLLEPVIKKNGAQLNEIPDIRNIKPADGGLFFDFTYLITQQEDNSNEGFYELEFEYMVNNRVKNAYFCFYLVNNTSYTQTANPEGKDFGYNAKPTLGWIDKGIDNFEKTELKNGFVRYGIGDNGLNETNISYPTITYDFTKYKLYYVHTANQKNTTYSYGVTYASTALGKTAKLVCEITSSGVTTTKEYALPDYKENSINLVTIMLTEPGTYVADYEFLYDGYVGTSNPIPAFETKEIKVSLHGQALYYSKAGYEGAKMQYLQIASTSNNSVNLIVPNGYELEEDTTSLKNKKLGFVYSLIEDVEEREGSIKNSTGNSALINDYLKSSTIYPNPYNLNESYSYFDYLLENVSNLNERVNISNILNEINANNVYAQTNQGSLWFESNDEYSADSFYFYYPTAIMGNTMFKEEPAGSGEYVKNILPQTLTNTTSFSSKGYYLVFVKVVPNGLNAVDAYWQVFAFQYTSASNNILIETKGEGGSEVVSNGKYTNQDVVVSWKKPGIFDRDVKAYFYSVTNKNYNKEQLLATTKNQLTGAEVDGYYQVNLGSSVTDNTFERYLIRLESEGESATHKLFTIDRQNITGIQAYLVQELYSGNSVYYSYATDKNGYTISIPNGITDSYATLNWDDKNSGANIYASYTYTPFVLDTSINAEVVNGALGQKWITTNYSLGTTIVGADLYKSSSPYLVESEAVLFNQGIYIIDLWDEAGNKSKYAFIIDRTQNYFSVEGNCVSNTSLLFGQDVPFSIGDYKAFNLNLTEETSTTTDAEKTLNEFIKLATANKLDTFDGYYMGSNTNATALNKLFQTKVEGEDVSYYFTVKNNSVVGYNGRVVDNKVFVDSKGDGVLIYEQSASTSFRRTIYVVGENHTYSNQNIKNNSYVTIEINKDNALGSIYYSNDSTFDTLTNQLYTGSDVYNDDGTVKLFNGLMGAGATSAKHVAFVWNMGTGNFEVETVSYKYYTLKVNVEPSDDLYFYSLSDEANLYSGGTWNTSLGAELMKDNSGRGIVRFNRTSDSKAGLYVVTRIYKDITGADLGDDVREKNYYFIVDRTGIIETGVGDSIRIDLMEGESEFANFTLSGTDYGILKYEGIDNERYNIYLTTTKLPATLNIPTGKYYSMFGSSKDYEAGQLNVEVYYYDRYNQLINQNKGKTVQLYASGFDYSVDVFNIDIYKYLSEIDIPLRDRITESSANGNWIFLPGDYIVRITDNVVNTLGETHSKYIGFRIATYLDQGPEIEVFNGYEQESMNKVVAENETLIVSQEYLKVVLPAYNVNETKKAQVDKNYIMVDQYLNGEKKEYLYHPYKQESGIPLNGDVAYSKYVTINNNGTEDESDDSINIWLDTKLRDASGNIDYANLTKSLKYEVTVRYKLNNYSLPYDDDLTINELTKYQNCYVYYNTNGKRVGDFYYKTYTIVIDREAPTNNVKYLNKNDGLVNEYNKMFNTTEMISSGLHETSANLYFTQQYTKYYEENRDNQYIYVYQVNDTTPFDVKDVNKIYVKEINDIVTHVFSLPVIDTSSYNRMMYSYELDDNNDGFGLYSGLGLNYQTYYEIVEVDNAGNATQYAVFFTNNTTEVSLPFSVTTTLNEEKIINVSSNQTVSETMFKINANGEVYKNTYFFKLTLTKSDGTKIFEKLTTLKSDFVNLSNEIATALNNEGFGSFSLRIKTLDNESVTHLKLYNEEIINSLETIKLVKDNNGNYHVNPETGKKSIYLHGANKTEIIDGQNVDFYATSITIKSGDVTQTYVAVIDETGIVKYFEKTAAGLGAEKVYIPLEDNTTYLISMNDIFGEVAPYRFNTSGYEFVVVEFEDVDLDAQDDFYHEVEGKNHMYYGFTTAKVKYDKTIYTTEVAQKFKTGYQEITFLPESLDAVYNQYTFEIKKDDIIEYRVRLFYEGEIEFTYFITIDTRLSSVTLRDSSSGEIRDLITIFDNVDYTSNDVRTFKPGAGRMTLNWNIIEENDYFDYDYRLYELLKDNQTFRKYKLVDGFYVESSDGEVGLNLNGKTSTVIATKEDSSGIYKFVISVYGKDGTYLGNKVYAFEVKEVNTQVYYVINKNGEELKSNSTFKFDDIKDELVKNNAIFKRDEEFIINSNINLPLYITNQEYKVQELSLNVEKFELTIVINSNYTLSIFRISKANAYDVFLGVLKVTKTSSIVENIFVNTTEITNQPSLTIVSDDKHQEVVVSADKIEAENENALYSTFIEKNTLILDVLYNDRLVSSQPFSSNYVIEGNGQYSFIFKDVAGNIHEYLINATQTVNELDVYVLREVVVTLNGEVPVNNAFYNEDVALSIYASSRYVIGSTSVTATKNGVKYKPTGFNPYYFSDYGTYRVVVKAKYYDASQNKTFDLLKVLSFTILNVEEARETIDLTNLNGCEISKVLNGNGDDVTNEFVNMIKLTGMKISYDDIMANAESLKVTSGKMTFKLTYAVEDMIYPKREITMSFTMNNEIPSVACSLKTGESSTKGFTISYNAAVLYDQIGESYIYINDKLVAHITADSANSEQKIKTTYKASGDGDYYVKLVSSSGVVLDSYKVTIKEPLNAWAIVVIVVVVAVVLTVTITIIVLRRKMRIR